MRVRVRVCVIVRACVPVCVHLRMCVPRGMCAPACAQLAYASVGAYLGNQLCVHAHLSCVCPPLCPFVFIFDGSSALLVG